MCAQTRKKKNPIAKAMKNIVLLLPTCAIASIGQKEVYETIVIGLKEVTTTKWMLATWKKNIYVLLPTCVIVATTPSSADYAIVASSFLV